VTTYQGRSDLRLSPDQVESFAQRINSAVRLEVKQYGESADPVLDRDFSAMNARHVEIYFQSLADDRTPTGPELAELADAGRRRLLQGVPLESIFQAYRIGTRVLWECLVERADPEHLARLGELTFQFADLVSLAASDGYAQERERRSHSHEGAWRLFLTRLLSGDLTDEAAVTREGRHFGFDLGRTHVVALISPRDHARSTSVEQDLRLDRDQSQLQRYLPDAPAVVLRAGLVVVVPGDSVLDVTQTVLKALAGEIAGRQLSIGFGTPRGGPAGIVASYAEAQRAQALGSILQPTTVVSRYDELRLFDLFRAGEPIDAFVNEVLGKLIRRDQERHSEHARTLEALFADALNRKLAARRLRIHANTLTYRTKRIEQLLGGSLLDGEFCFRVQLALRLLPLSSLGRAEADTGT
jgi:sugar diacid utilization regulator